MSWFASLLAKLFGRNTKPASVSAQASSRSIPTGVRPSAPDSRDFKFLDGLSQAAATGAIDLRPYDIPIYNQGSLNSCTACAACACFAIDAKRQHAKFSPSRLFVYYNSRLIEGTENQDNGCNLRDTFKALAKVGACDEADWAYIPSTVNVRPPKSRYAAAGAHKALRYGTVPQTLDGIRASLSAGYPVAVSLELFQSFLQTENGGNDDRVPMPGSSPFLAGHAMVVVGHLPSLGEFIVRNSFGASWGRNGYVYFPEQYILDPSLCKELWAVQAVSK